MKYYTIPIRSAIFRIFLFLLVVFTSINLNAQIKSGNRVGFNIATLSIRYNGEIIKPETSGGIQIGSTFEIPFAKKLTFQSGFLFSSKGTDFNIGTEKYSFAPAYLELPVHSVYYFGKGSLRVSLFSGPYFSCAFGGYKIEDEVLKNLSFGHSDLKDMKNIDFGIDFGLGINYKGFVLSMQYGTGFRDVSPKSELSMKNQVIGISIGFLR